MNKKELVERVALEMDVSKTTAKEAVNAVFESILLGVEHDDEVKLVGFGTFRKKQRKARKGHNPQTGQALKIPAKTVLSFKPSKSASERLA